LNNRWCGDFQSIPKSGRTLRLQKHAQLNAGMDTQSEGNAPLGLHFICSRIVAKQQTDSFACSVMVAFQHQRLNFF
jgi:hypothetical protein